MCVTRNERRQILTDLTKACEADLHLSRDLWRLQIVVDHPARLIFDLFRRQAVVAARWCQYALSLLGDGLLIKRAEIVFGTKIRGVLAGIGTVDESAEHIIMRHARHVADCVKAGERFVRACSSTQTPDALWPEQSPISDMCISTMR